MQDSFMSFCGISAQKWIINVRGLHNINTVLFLREHLGEKLSPHILESDKGWFYDSRQLIDDVKTDFVMVWVEDHINLKNVAIYSHIINEMAESKSEYLNYTWWFFGQSRNIFKNIVKEEYRYIESFYLDKDNAHGLDLYGRIPYIISMPSIFSKDLFFKIINKDDPKLRRWPKETPFDFEKNGKDYHWLPIKMSVAKEELFASIDDNNGFPGYSLQSRGLYSNRVIRSDPKPSKDNNIIGKMFSAAIPKSLKRFILRLTYHI